VVVRNGTWQHAAGIWHSRPAMGSENFSSERMIKQTQQFYFDIWQQHQPDKENQRNGPFVNCGCEPIRPSNIS
jgi:hypothetical protein